MASSQNEFSKLGFAKTFVLPALLVFAIPAISLPFFLHAQSVFDQQARDSILHQIRSDKSMPEEERARAIEFFNTVPFSQYILNKDVAAKVDRTALFNFATFRWMIRLSFLSLVAGAAVFIIAGICVAISARFPSAQYWFLTVGWQLLRIYGAIQTVVLGALVLALSFWVTALWFHVYYVKLILVAGIIAIGGVCIVIAAIFRVPKSQFAIEGVELAAESHSPLWERLKAICQQVGTNPPDHVVAGIDDNFFVTETPLMVSEQPMQGKVLYVSLPLLKQLNAGEASAVLAHEMAHFSGNDTVFSKKIAPLLRRYEHYLNALYQGGITLPVFYFMNCFRAMFELSLGKVSREREFRADRIAADVTSPQDISSALLRIAAYSKFRNAVEMDLFSNQQELAVADISDRIGSGFHDFADKFAKDPAIGQSETSHPFDSHPPMLQRFEALGIGLTADEAASLISGPGDGGWYENITDAEQLERSLWTVYEDRFRKYHEQSLPYRFLPATPEERAIVEKDFPAKVIESKSISLSIDCDKLELSTWDDPLTFREITKCTLHDSTRLDIAFDRGASKTRSIDTKKFDTQVRQLVLSEFERYYGRFLAAVDYQKHVAEMKKAESGSSDDTGLSQ